jgi:tetratricopeptide (TPR) repeat protein
MRTRVVLIVWVVALAWVTSGRVRVFQTGKTLWADAHAKAPTKPRPTLNYARELELSGDVAGAEALYREVIAQAWDPRRPAYMRLSSQAAAETNIAHLRIKAGKFASAMEILDQTLKYWPIYPYAHFNRGTIFWELGLCEEARKEYQQAIDRDPALSLPTNPCQPREGVD